MNQPSSFLFVFGEWGEVTCWLPWPWKFGGLHKTHSWKKNLLDRHQLLANQTDINTTVSSHWLGIAVPSAWKYPQAGNPQQRCCFSDTLPLWVTWPGARHKGSEGPAVTSPQQVAQTTTQSSVGVRGPGGAGSFCEPSSLLLFSNHYHQSPAEWWLPTNCTWLAAYQCTNATIHTKIKNEKLNSALSKPLSLFLL